MRKHSCFEKCLHFFFSFLLTGMFFPLNPRSFRFLKNLKVKSCLLFSQPKQFERTSHFDFNSSKHLQNYILTTSSLSNTPLESFSTQPENVSSLHLEINFTGMVVVLITCSLWDHSIQHSNDLLIRPMSHPAHRVFSSDTPY